METIFDHNPTDSELDKLIGNTSKDSYLSELKYAPEGENYLFITFLYEMRKDENKASEYRNLVPALYKEYNLGLDNFAIPSY